MSNIEVKERERLRLEKNNNNKNHGTITLVRRHKIIKNLAKLTPYTHPQNQQQQPNFIAWSVKVTEYIEKDKKKPTRLRNNNVMIILDNTKSHVNIIIHRLITLALNTLFRLYGKKKTKLVSNMKSKPYNSIRIGKELHYPCDEKEKNNQNKSKNKTLSN